jgi:DNA-binding NarL/FixJ family response regulator
MPVTSPTGRKTRILIVDDHPVVRLGLTHLLSNEPDLEVCGEAESAAEAQEKVEAMAPDLVLVDISLPDTSGLELIKRLKAKDESLKMLVASMHDEKLFAERALKAGALGYVHKEEAPDDIVTAIRRVLSGKVYLSPAMTDHMLQTVTGGEPQTLGVASLSDRELEVFSLLGQARTTQEIADRLHLSVKTVETYRENIKSKLGLTNHNELIRRAVEWSLRQP